MTKDELVAKLRDIEWEDFEVKAAKSELPKNVWESVSDRESLNSLCGLPYIQDIIQFLYFRARHQRVLKCVLAEYGSSFLIERL